VARASEATLTDAFSTWAYDLAIEEAGTGAVTQPNVASSEPADAPDEHWLDSVAQAIIGAYYPDAVRAGGAARQRAQAVQSILSGIVGGTVGVTLASLDGEQIFVVLLGIFALALWLGATALFVAAIGAATAASDRHVTEVQGRDAFIREVLRRASADRDRVSRLHSMASRLAFVALGVTTAFWMSAALSESGPPTHYNASVVLASSVKSAVESTCPAVKNIASIPASRIVLDIPVRITIAARACGRAEDVTILLDRKDVRALLENP
jgi:MFS family permease